MADNCKCEETRPGIAPPIRHNGQNDFSPPFPSISADRISLSQDVPLDIKFMILESLDTIDSLRALLFTCRAFYDISQTHLWNSIYKKVLEKDIGVVGRTLVKLLRFKSGKTVQELCSALPTDEDDNHESAAGYLDDLISTRRTVQFFTSLFLGEMFYEQLSGLWGDRMVSLTEIEDSMSTISLSEYQRVEKAYYTLWLFVELNYSPGFVRVLDYLGFKKLEALLRKPLTQRRVIVSRMTSCDWMYPRPNIEGQYGWDVVALYNNKPQYHVQISWWAHMMKGHYMENRRLWRERGRRYRPEIPPWDPQETEYRDTLGLNLMAIMWDDERLAAWGYFKPENASENL
ncbi:hypothetical protein ABW21_db0209235 [Orbilia brochopaga]|nr:hypothetical protein ABW21_db0209235 [Drechslerella brochopaga]